MLEKYLQEIGLAEKEAAVYAALLQVESDSVLDIAKKTKINRTTIYPVLESLAKKGLITEVRVDKKIRFQAEPPERLETYVERQKVVLNEQGRRLKDIIPQLKSVQREVGERPVVKYFEGREGIISSLEDFFSTNDEGGEAYLLYSKDLLQGLFTDKEQEKFRSLRLKQHIKTKVLYTTAGIERPSDNMGQRIRIDGKKYPISCDISIYKDRVRINTLGKSLSGIYILSQDLADTLRSLFDIAFDQLKKEE